MLGARLVPEVFPTDLGSWTAPGNHRRGAAGIEPAPTAADFVLDTLSSSELNASDPRSSYAHGLNKTTEKKKTQTQPKT